MRKSCHGRTAVQIQSDAVCGNTKILGIQKTAWILGGIYQSVWKCGRISAFRVYAADDRETDAERIVDHFIWICPQLYSGGDPADREGRLL